MHLFKASECVHGILNRHIKGGISQNVDSVKV